MSNKSPDLNERVSHSTVALEIRRTDRACTVKIVCFKLHSINGGDQKADRFWNRGRCVWPAVAGLLAYCWSRLSSSPQRQTICNLMRNTTRAYHAIFDCLHRSTVSVSGTILLCIL